MSKMANKQTPYIATNTEKHTNTPPSGGWLVAFLAIPLLVFALSFQIAPARAQGAFVTPTPLPAIEATKNAAQSAQSAANDARSQAAQLRAQAEEIQRNADAQQAQIAADLANASAAASAQNGIAFGQAIGQAQEDLKQFQDSLAGQDAIIATLTARNEILSNSVVTLTVELNQARVSQSLILTNYTALSNRFEAVSAEAKQSANSAPVVTFVFAAGFVAMLIVVIIVVLQRREANPIDDVDTVNEDEVIEGEVTA